MKHLFIAFAVFILLVSSFITFKSTKLCSRLESLISDNVEVLSYSNEGPGAQGQRHTQAVWCGGGGWNIAVGCCYGSENCTYINCSSNSFSCDGNTWIPF